MAPDNAENNCHPETAPETAGGEEGITHLREDVGVDPAAGVVHLEAQVAAGLEMVVDIAGGQLVAFAARHRQRHGDRALAR